MNTVLLVEDDDLFARAITRLVGERAQVRLHARAGPALAALMDAESEAKWVGAIVDVGLPDGSGVELTRRIRDYAPLLPVLVLTGQNDRYLANGALAAGAQFAFKPVEATELHAFLDRALHHTPEQRIARAIERLSSRSYLSEREVEIVRLAVAGHGRPSLARRFAVTDNTLKTQIRSLLSKCHTPTLDELVRNVLAEAIDHG